VAGLGFRKGICAALSCAALASLALTAEAGAAVLYDQNDNGNGLGTFSVHDTTSTAPPSPTEIADDFTVPPGATWVIRGVEVTGAYDSGGTGPVSGVNVRLYTDSAGLPNTIPLLEQLDTVPVDGNAGTPSFSLAVTGAPNLPGAPVTGTRYWVSVQANIDFPTKVWDWSNRTVQSGNPAVFRSQGSVGGACTGGGTTWHVKSACGSLTAGPDQMFRLCDAACTTPAAPPSETNTPPGNPTSPVNPAGHIRKRKCKKKSKASAQLAKRTKCKKKKH
jgi:hypothetical protein